MRKVCTLAFIGCISFTGFAAHAQLPGAGFTIDSIFQSFTVEGAMGQFMDTPAPVEQQVSAIEGPLVVEIEVSEVNQTAAEVIDSRTGLYPPRLKINFAEFPLRTLANGANNVRNGRNGASTDVIVQRIQNRLRLSQINLVVEDRVAIVSGTVATERQRNLVASMLRFEPGIDTVKNEIAVVP